jgi:hypothetical protein
VVHPGNETVGTLLGEHKSATVCYFGTALAAIKHMSSYRGHKPDSSCKA